MPRGAWLIALSLLGSPALVGQTVAAPAASQVAAAPVFDVAAIKPSQYVNGQSSGISTGHGTLDARNVTVRRCILGAYDLGPQQVLGGPDWVNTDRFDILAKMDPSVTTDREIMLALRALLADRFKLVIHRDQQVMSALVLEPGKRGPQLKPSDGGEASTNSSSSNASETIEAKNITLDSFARALSRRLDRPVLNSTGLPGTYNLKIHWIAETGQPAASDTNDAGSIYSALEEQLGLHLRAARVPIETVVIDHVEQPSAN